MEDGSTCLDIAFQKGNETIVAYLMDHEDHVHHSSQCLEEEEEEEQEEEQEEEESTLTMDPLWHCLESEESIRTACTNLNDVTELELFCQERMAWIRQHKQDLIDKQLNDSRPDYKFCVICQLEEKSILLLPCRHLCLCQKCSRRKELQSCPLCREEIQDKMHVFA